MGELSESDLQGPPWQVLKQWIEDAQAAGHPEPSAMNLATVHHGQPSSRFVLLRGLDDAGLVFFSHSTSQKGREIAQEPRVACCFWWPETERQVRVEGKAVVLSRERAEDYFRGRPRDSQLATLASPQSDPIASREQLLSEMERLAVLHPDQVPLPDRWACYLIEPTRWEFWQGRPARLHDRFSLKLVDGRWVVQRLAP